MNPTPEQVFATLADRTGSVWLDGGGRDWSVLAWDPVEVCTDGHGWPAAGRELSKGPAVASEAPFAGGCLGFLGFGAGHRVAPVPESAPSPEPEVWLGRYRGGLCFRHADASWHIAGDADFHEQARAQLAGAEVLEPVDPDPGQHGAQTVDQERYEADVERILEWIAAGDCYQVNLTRPVWVDDPGDPWTTYRRLRHSSSAAHGAFLRLTDELAIASNSPELFLEIEGTTARSRPIKGTRPRGRTAREDRQLATELFESPKERAELTMIVDLVRNDLGRLAVPGSVRTGPREIETHANVHHAWQEVQAELESGFDAWDALAATFPPGSVTGAPKVRACQRIAELEPHPRGVYCGAIGFVDTRGRASWSVAIRTAVFAEGRARYHVGGGVVAASNPRDEWLETEAKGRQLARALGLERGVG